MSNREDIKTRLKDLKSHIDNEIHQFIKVNQGLINTSEEDIILDSRLQKFKPSKHKKAYKIEKNFKKRCYSR